MGPGLSAIVELLEGRIRHLKGESARNPRADYGRMCHARRLECEYLLKKILEMVEEPQ